MNPDIFMNVAVGPYRIYHVDETENAIVVEWTNGTICGLNNAVLKHFDDEDRIHIVKGFFRRRIRVPLKRELWVWKLEKIS